MDGASITVRRVYEWSRLGLVDGWWAWAALVLIGLAIPALVTALYRRDAAAMPRGVRFALIASRLSAIAAAAVWLAGPVRRTERVAERPSEVAVLVDVSQSMTLPSEVESPAASAASAFGGADRFEVARRLVDSDSMEELGRRHRVTVYGIGEEESPQVLRREAEESVVVPDLAADSSEGTSVVAYLAAVVLAIGLVVGAASLGYGATGRSRWLPGLISVAAVTTLAGLAGVGGAYAVGSFDTGEPGDGSAAEGSVGSVDTAEVEPRVDRWDDVVAEASASRLGDGVAAVVRRHDPTTLAAVVLISDGQTTDGRSLASGVAEARRNEIGVVTVGLGSDREPSTVRIVDADVPRRVFPDDSFAVPVTLTAGGGGSRRVRVELVDAPENGGAASSSPAASDSQPPTSDSAGDVVASREVTLTADGTLRTVPMEVPPRPIGRRRLVVRLRPIDGPATGGGGHGPDTAPDGGGRVRSRYTVVSRRSRVLAIAGGPTREYRFVRNLLYRDPTVELDVWLQTGRDGISQDADRLLDAFPASAAELFDYDTVVMFDPDWSRIDAAGVDLLDRYLATQAGGLMLVAGPVYQPRWTSERGGAKTTAVAGLYPVVLSTGTPVSIGGRTGGDQPWPLDLTEEAANVPFLNFDIVPPSQPNEGGDVSNADAEDAAGPWGRFDGVYDFAATRGVKPGATTYATFSDPTAVISGRPPILLASQFYGAGRVLYQGTGEMWRLRGVDEDWFDAYWTAAVRWCGEGRLQRDGRRGVLLVDREKTDVGRPVEVRAVLLDDQFKPVVAPEVVADLLPPPDSGLPAAPLRLLADDSRPGSGTFVGRFNPTVEGEWSIRIGVGQDANREVLSREVRVRLPRTEIERRRRNDDALSAAAEMTEGRFFPIDGPDDLSAAGAFLAAIEPQPRTDVLPGSIDTDFNRRRNAAMLWFLVTALSMEWIIRRLHRLA